MLLAWHRLRFRGETRARAYERLAQLHEQGVPLLDALHRIYSYQREIGGGGGIAPVLEVWIRGLSAGQDIAQVLRPWVPAGHVGLLAAVSGGSDRSRAQVFRVCAELERLVGQMRLAVLGAIGQPLFLFAVLLAFIWFFGLRVLPAFSQLIPVEEWRGPSAVLPWMFDLVRSFGFQATVVGGLLSAVAFAVLVLPNWSGALRRGLDAVLPFSLYRVFQGTVFLTGLVGVLRSRLPLEEALGQMLGPSTPYVRAKVFAVLQRLRSGQVLGEALWAAEPDFPSRSICSDLRLMLSFPGYEDYLEAASGRWQTDALATIRALGKVMRLVSMAFVFGVLVTLVLGMVQLPAQLSQSLG